MNNLQTKCELLSLDLDGTLLKTATSKAQNGDRFAIQEMMDSGTKVIINSGRPPWRTLPAIKQIDSAGKNKIQYMSCLNGTYIQDLISGEVISNPLSDELTRKIIELLKPKRNIYLWLYTVKGIQDKVIKMTPYLLLFNFLTNRGNIKNIVAGDDLTTYKVDLLFPFKSTCTKTYNFLINCYLKDQIRVTKTGDRIIEITQKNISKSFAIEYVAKQFNIQKQNIVSMGDTPNDLEAFKASGVTFGIKPKNKALYQYCNYVIDTKTNGVAKAIHKYLLKKETR